MKRELEYFFAALRFFTRLPVPAWVGHDAEQLNHAARYFPLVGILVGAIGALVTELAALALPIGVAVLLGMAATVLTTGGFHEDGFADSCDGFGGGWDKGRVLAIMKDSRIGSHAAIGLGLLLLTKWNVLVEIDATFGPPLLAMTLVAGHAVSRLASTVLISTSAILLPYAASSAAWLHSGGKNGGRVIAALALVYSLFALSGAGTEALAWGVVLLLAGVPVFLWMRRVKAR